MRRLSAVSAVLLLALMAATAHAQSTTGTIAGRIVDAQGLATPGATVTVTGPQGAKTTVTDTEGRFNLPFLTPGLYALRAELQGFKMIERADIQVRLDQTVDLPSCRFVERLVGGAQIGEFRFASRWRDFAGR